MTKPAIMLNPPDTEAWPDRYNHPKVSLAFTDAIMNAKEGDLVGVLGNFLRGPKIRQRYKEALSTPVVVVNRPIQKGKKIDLPEFINFYGGTGTFRGKQTIFISNLDENELVKTLLHEGAHVMFNLRGMPSLTSDLGSSTGRSEYFKSNKEKMVDSFADEAWHEPEDDATESNPLEITNDQIDGAIDVHAYSLVMVDPYKFLMLTTMSNSHLREIQKEAKTLDEYNRFNSNLMPFLWINRNTGRIEGHEGRHRAAAILANGESEMPVAIRLLPRERNAETWDFVPPVWIGQFNTSLKMKVPSVVVRVLKTNLRDLSESVSLDHAQIEDWYDEKMSQQNVESNPADLDTRHAELAQRFADGLITQAELDEAQALVDEAAEDANYTFHRYSQNPNGVSGAAYLMFAADQSEVERGYGPYHFVASDANAVDVETLRDEIVEALEEHADEYESENADAIGDELNPSQIVVSAEAWDNQEVVRVAWEYVLEPRGITKVKTQDGLIVFDERSIKSAGPFTFDDDGYLIPLSERFQETSPDIRHNPPDIRRNPSYPNPVHALRDILEQIQEGKQPGLYDFGQVLRWLDIALTGRTMQNLHDYARSAELMLDQTRGEFYLSDGGYSRVWMDLDDGKAWVTDNSTAEVKRRWKALAEE